MHLGRLGRLAFMNTVSPTDIDGGVPLPYNWRGGLLTSQDTDTDHDIQIAAGAARGTGDTGDIKLSAVITKQLDATWAAGDDAGGLNATDFAAGSSGIEPDTWYHVFVIGKADGTVDAGFDKNIAATNLLSDSGYTYYRRVGSVRSNSTAAPNANILAYTQVGNHFIWADPIGQTATNTQDAHITTTLNGVPTGVSVLAELNVHFSDAAAITAGIVYSPYSDENVPVITTPSAGEVTSQFNAGAGAHALRKLWVRTNTSAQVKHYVDGTSTMTFSNMAVLGWRDDLGDFD